MGCGVTFLNICRCILDSLYRVNGEHIYFVGILCCDLAEVG